MDFSFFLRIIPCLLIIFFNLQYDVLEFKDRYPSVAYSLSANNFLTDSRILISVGPPNPIATLSFISDLFNLVLKLLEQLLEQKRPDAYFPSCSLLHVSHRTITQIY